MCASYEDSMLSETYNKNNIPNYQVKLHFRLVIIIYLVFFILMDTYINTIHKNNIILHIIFNYTYLQQNSQFHGFMFNEKFHENTSKFAIFLEWENPNRFFSFFISSLYTKYFYKSKV